MQESQNNEALQRQLRNLSNNLSDLVSFMSTQQGEGNSPNRPDQSETNRRQTEVARRVQNTLSQSSDSFSRAIGAAIRTTGESNRLFTASVQENIDAYAALMDEYERSGRRMNINEEIMRRFGIRVEGAAVSVSEMSEHMRMLEEERLEAARAVERESITLRSSLSEIRKSINATAIVMGTLAGAGRETLSLTRAAAESGADITLKEAYTSRMLGMSHAELISMNGQYLQVMGASNQTTVQWSDKMREGAEKMNAFTKSTEEAGRLTAENIKLSKLSGADSATAVNGFTESLNQSFEQANRVFGMTSETFTELNSAMYNNASMQELMYKQSKSARLEGMAEAVARRNYLMDLGLMANQADAFIASLAEMTGGGSEKERQVEAGKFASALGAMGLGAEGQEARAIMLKGPNASKDERDRLVEIKKMAHEVSSSNHQSTETGVRLQQEYIDGLTKYLGPDSPTADLVRQEALALEKQEQLEQARNDASIKWLHDLRGTINQYADIAGNLMKDNVFGGTFAGVVAGINASSLGKLLLMKMGAGAMRAGGGIASGSRAAMAATQRAGQSILATVPRIFSALSTGLSTAGSAVVSVGGAVGRLALGAGKLLGPIAALGAAFYVGWEAGTKLNNFINEKFPEFGNLIGKVLYNIVEGGKKVGGFFVDIFNGIISGFNSLGQLIFDFFARIKDFIMAPLDSVKSWGDDFSLLVSDIADGSVIKNIGGMMGFGEDDKPEPAVVAPIKNIAKEIENVAKATELSKEEKEAQAKMVEDTKNLQELMRQLNEHMGRNDASSRLIAESLEKQTNAILEGTDKTVEELNKNAKPMYAR